MSATGNRRVPSPPRVEVEVSPRVREASRSWDGAATLGRGVLARHAEVVRCRVAVHANRRDLLRWRFGEDAIVSVYWPLLFDPDRLLAVLDGDRVAWDELLEKIPAAPLPALRTRGEVHDLDALLAEQRHHLEDPQDVAITWGRFGRAPRRVLRLGSCAPGEPPIIRIHPVLDHESVPAWFVGYVLFHELLHLVFPPTAGEGRRIVHPPALRRAERSHPDYVRAMAWERGNVDALLARCRGR